MRLNPARFNRFLAGIGQDLAWRPSHACPCVRAYSGAADPSCRHCAGKGRRWDTAIACHAGIVSHEIARKYAPMGLLDAGDVLLVIPSDSPVYAIGEFDRVVMTDRTEPFSLNLIPGSNVLRFDPVSIHAVTWLNARGELVDGLFRFATPDGAVFVTSDGREFTLKLTFEVRPDGTYAYLANGVTGGVTPPPLTPPPGATVSISGRRHPEYFCYLTLALDRPHHSGEPLPRRVLLRRYDLFGA